MYNELYEAWKRELESTELGRLPPDFYAKVASYLRRLMEETRMLDKRAMRTALIKREIQNVKRLVHNLAEARYRKLMGKAIKGEKVPLDVLTTEEEGVYTKVYAAAEAYQNFVKGVLRGYTSRVSVEREQRKAILRFIKDVPEAIVGVDMKVYGPFKTEDVASLPIENAKILIERGLAEEVIV